MTHRESESGRHPIEKLTQSFELLIVVAAGLLLAAAILAAAGVLYVVFINGLREKLGGLDTVHDVQEAVRNVFAGVLLLVLGLELLETLKGYFADHHLKTETILVVAMIAVGRHIIQIDFEHTSGAVLVGTALLMLALSASYVLVRWSVTRPSAPGGT